MKEFNHANHVLRFVKLPSRPLRNSQNHTNTQRGERGRHNAGMDVELEITLFEHFFRVKPF